MEENGEGTRVWQTAHSYGKLFMPGRKNQLKRALCEKVQHGLRQLDRATLEVAPSVVSELLDEMEEHASITQTPLRRLNDSTSTSTPLCADCKKPSCCIVFHEVDISSDDIRRVSTYLGVSVEDFVKRHCQPRVHNRSEFMLKNVAPCEFLTKDDQCSIYQARPTACKDFPLATDGEGRETIRIFEWCNFRFNMLRYEATLRVLSRVMQRRDS